MILIIIGIVSYYFRRKIFKIRYSNRRFYFPVEQKEYCNNELENLERNK
jgi:hypothetical protein